MPLLGEDLDSGENNDMIHYHNRILMRMAAACPACYVPVKDVGHEGTIYRSHYVK